VNVAAVHAIVALVVFVATTIQACTSVVELGRSNREAVDWMLTEDLLVSDQRRHRRWRTRRELKAVRDKKIHATSGG
jgi:hypothetical protein